MDELYDKPDRNQLPISEQIHHLRRRTSLAQQEGHYPHRFVDVMEEIFIPPAEIVQTLFAFRGMAQAVLRAAPVTGETHITFQAIFRQLI